MNDMTQTKTQTPERPALPPFTRRKHVAFASMIAATLSVLGVAAMTIGSVFIPFVATQADGILGIHWFVRVIGVSVAFLLVVGVCTLIPPHLITSRRERQMAGILAGTTLLSVILVLLSFAYMGF